jgi:biopolymer transport protein ExbD
MGMNVPQGDDDDVMVEMNTTPLIDVMLVMIIMLIITIPVQTHAVKLDMPSPNAAPPTTLPEVIKVDVDFDGTITWNGNVVTDAETLKTYLLQTAKAVPQPELHLRPHKLAKYDTVAKILATAQRLGVKNMGIVGNEQFVQ